MTAVCAIAMPVLWLMNGRAAASATLHAVSYGVETRIPSAVFLRMPQTADGPMPLLLSQTGAFSNTRSLTTTKGLLPYELAVPFWSDGADKSRWVAIPPGKIMLSAAGEWSFPPGTVFVKTFELPTDALHPAMSRRLETRILVCDSTGGVYGVDYKWRPDNSDADLLTGNLTESLSVAEANGTIHQQSWYYPSRQECLTCHNANAGGVLGLKTDQMNHSFTYPSGVRDNQLRTWNHLRLFEPALDEASLANLPSLAPRTDLSRTLADRARSYLDANCSQCHRPGGTVANFDARYETPLNEQGIVDGPVLIDQGIDHPRVLAPHDPWRSIMLMRVNTMGDIRMPPLARETIDVAGVELLRQWVESFPGRSVLSPPVISPEGGTFASPVEITLSQSQPGSEIRYTLDGSVPGAADPLYHDPIKLAETAVLRTRAYETGFTRSIVTQQLFIVGK